MIKPLQRICRYQLLICEYFKNLDESHVDYQNVQMAFNEIGNLLNLTNEMKQKVDDVDQIFEMFSSLGVIFSHTSSYLWSIVMSYVPFQGMGVTSLFDRSQMNCTLFLISDILIVSWGTIPKLTIIDAIPFSEAPIFSMSHQSSTSFDIIFHDKGKQGTFEFSSFEEKNSAYEQISCTLKSYLQLQKEKIQKEKECDNENEEKGVEEETENEQMKEEEREQNGKREEEEEERE